LSGVPDVYRLWRWQLSPVAGRLDDDRAIGSAGLLRGGTNRLSRGLAARDDHDSGGHRVEVDDSHHGAPPDRLTTRRLGCLPRIVIYLSCLPACRRMEVGAGREGPARAETSAPDPSEHGWTWDELVRKPGTVQA